MTERHPAPIGAQARTSPAAARNCAPILDVLRAWLPGAPHVLEIASGTGEHAVWLSTGLPDARWQPTERDAEALASIAAWRAASGPPNLLPPLRLDVSGPWPAGPFDAVVAINLIHIAPWSAAESLLAGAAQVLGKDGVLYLYGPFHEVDVALADGNAAFDADLQARDPAWGLRALDAVAALAAGQGLHLEARTAMPANNLSVLFRRR